MEYVGFGIGLVVGYALGWHRGALGLPLLMRRRPKIVAATDPAERRQAEFVQSRRGQIKADLKVRYPYLTEAQRDAALAEILEKGQALRADFPSPSSAASTPTT